MRTVRSRSTRTARILLAASAALALSLTAACSSSSGSSGGSGGKPVSAADALNTPTTLTFWTWVPNIQKTVDLFEQKYPKIKVKVVNAGQSADEYTKLQTAIKAGSGAPDVAQIEYFALPQFALSKQVVNLSDYGAGSLKSSYTDSAWAQVAIDNGIYGYPQDTGPLTMFYRTDIFKQLGIAVPTTWDEFAKAAEKIHAADPTHYIASIDPGDAGGVDSLIWQAGGRPFQGSGTSVKLNLKDAGTAKFAQLWSSLLAKKLVDPTPGWTTDWWKGMGSGKYAVWIAGAWAPGSLESTIAQTSGKWAAAPVPQWTAGANVSSENGGSSDAVISTSPNKAAAAAFAAWLNSDPVATASLSANGLFPATTALLNSQDFLGKKFDFFGGQQANQVFAANSKAVAPGWQYLPYQVYANSVFKDSVGKAISEGTDLGAALGTWQSTIGSYGTQQGFSVSNG
ncbi:ABC transporter substrate-binding protein [Streptacidiphilus monticola]|uniref:ABC transporter substrate-binding protein n=1 Tax=Streptacidiphilus monticola TaxID=2161674 RepID=A0ABW1FXD2_9ACTN